MLATDPGLGHLQAGWRSLVSMVVSLAVGYGMAHALHIPSMLGMTVGGMIGMMSAFVIAENTPLRLARASLWVPIPFSAALSVGAWLQPHRMMDLCLMVVMLALAFFLIRFGLMGLLTGMMMFNALLIGRVAVVPLDDCGRLCIIAMVTAAAVLVARLMLCYPMPREDLLRTQRAFVVEARRVADAAATALDPHAHQDVAIKQMRRALRQLNVTTLTIDGRLALPEVAAEPDTAELLHQYLFDAELALQGIGHAVQEMTRRPVPSALREAMVVGLVIVRDTPLGRADALHPAAELIRQEATNASKGTGPDEAELRALAQRVGDLLDTLADSLACWLDLGWNTPTARAKVPFQPSVALEQGRLAGAGPAARRLADAQGDQGWRRAIPYVRAPLQVGIAAAIVLPIADTINGQRFYWALIGVMITMFGTNTTHERLRKVGHRMVGTVVGAVIGIAVLHLIGPGHIYWTLLVIVAGLGFGSWGIQRRYAYWVTGLVIALVQLYGLATPYGNLDWLLTQRLLDNALGMAAATVCAALVFPLSTRKIAHEAQHGYLAALEQLIVQVAERWKDPEAPVRLRGAARGVDAALYQTQSVLRPLVRMRLGTHAKGGDNLLALLGTATAHARALAVAADIDLAPQLRVRVERLTEVFASSLHALDRQIATGERGGTWIRVSPLIRELEFELRAPAGPRADRLRVALGELAALDEVLASLASNRGLTIRTTASAPSPSAAGVTSPVHGTVLTGTRYAPPAQRKPAEEASNARGTGTSVRTESGMPSSQHAEGTEAGRGAGDGTVTVRGAVRCAEHSGCEVWITIVTGRGKRQAMVKAGNGSYAINGLTPRGYTLIVSSSAHPPHAEFLLVHRPGRDLRHDITLGPAS
ncbi:FUSC family protein [Actinacidiphila soli]|uniref:FUSC family protein n=1 Tax=Actinacidiphila soli TaxID=2487275 RepID=UPI001F0B788C|nr:FUSC family protein [Actinacidiphila soli]